MSDLKKLLSGKFYIPEILLVAAIIKGEQEEETHSKIDLIEGNPAELREGEKGVTMTTTFTTTTITDYDVWKHGEKE